MLSVLRSWYSRVLYLELVRLYHIVIIITSTLRPVYHYQYFCAPVPVLRSSTSVFSVPKIQYQYPTQYHDQLVPVHKTSTTDQYQYQYQYQ
jgi:hypothetical protein